MVAERSTARPVDWAARHRVESERQGRHGRRRARQRYEDEYEDEDTYEQRYPQPQEYTPYDSYLEEEDFYEVPHPQVYEADEADDDRRTRRKHARELHTHVRPGSGRLLWLIPVGGLAVAVLLCALPFMWGSDRPPERALPAPAPITPPEVGELPIIIVAETPSTSPSPSPKPRSSTTPSVTPTPTPTVTTPAPIPGPVLLGPASGGGVENMVERYCDRHSGGSADARSDGRWQCRRLLSSSNVDMNVACRDIYGSGAYALSLKPGDAYAWRCYR